MCPLNLELAFRSILPYQKADVMVTLPWVVHTEPINALSIPTCAVHFSSGFEFLVVMKLVWDFFHANGICART